jgi:NADPH2:quinone reductase
MNPFRAFRIYEEHGAVRARIESVPPEVLNDGEILIQSAYSGINFKDALAATGRGKILKRFPLTGGIDVSGTVVRSASSHFKEGDDVLAAGGGIGERYDGGFAEYVRLKEDCAVPLPKGLTLFEAMVLGTAGFTAALALHRFEENQQDPGSGPLVVTGAGGGVGNIAVDMFSNRGYRVTAVTSKKELSDRLQRLGAESILLHDEITMGTRPLENALWGSAVDTLGGPILGWLTRTVKEWGNIACIGNAGGPDLNTTVMPFILRGVNLLGISSANCPHALRLEIWKRLGSDLKPRHLDLIHTQTVPMENLMQACEAMMARQTQGRTVVIIS